MSVPGAPTHAARGQSLTQLFPTCHESYSGNARFIFALCTPRILLGDDSTYPPAAPPTATTLPSDKGTVPHTDGASANGATPQRHWQTSSITTAAAKHANTTTSAATKISASLARHSGCLHKQARTSAPGQPLRTTLLEHGNTHDINNVAVTSRKGRHLDYARERRRQRNRCGQEMAAKRRTPSASYT